ncbi:MAG TPA: hypothetical protein VHH73_20910, partial [Verrucomicrobiae bacterium]|nr:hypothetical protein [Verrucomicrobiae bacterium]
MLHRLVLLILIAFWLVMNTLLWRSEFGGKVEPGNGVPVGVVWQKILTAPDDSGLAVLQEGKRIGFLRWAPNVGEEKATGKTGTEEIEGMVKVLANYR